MHIEVRDESVVQAVQRLSRTHKKIAVLNFASPTNPGGGFLNGRSAQEESIARSSALYPSIARHKEMYEHGAQHPTPFSSDSMIYSPSVPFFRDDSGQLLEQPVTASVITAAAVNASHIHDRGMQSQIDRTMKNRMRKVIELAAEQQNKVLVLGAFGCGVFGNDPNRVAQIQRELLVDEGLGQHFDVIVNPIMSRGGDTQNLQVFQRVLATTA